MPFKKCSECQGQARAVTIVQKFASHDCGHVLCKECGITHDSNVDEISTESLTAADISAVKNEDEYRRLFVETSTIRDSSGNDYAKFDWESQDSLRRGVAEHVLEPLQHKFASNEALDILDLGCGSGFTSSVLADSFPNARLTSLDPSPQVSQVHGYKDRVNAIQGTIQSADEMLGEYDVIIILGNLMLHDDPMSTLNLAVQHLRTGGRLLFDFKNIKSSPRQISIIVARLGISRLLPQSLFNRIFVNMRFGFHEEYLDRFMKTLGMEMIARKSKAPRLLEFSNKSSYVQGWQGVVWRVLDRFDRVRQQQAWIQLEYVRAPSS